MTDRHKVLIVILDGLGDLPNPALDGKTPLQSANTPVLDHLAAQGVTALAHPVSPGVIAETHAGTAPLMGLDPAQMEAFARGPIEAAGAGMDLAPGDIALRGNLATLVRDGTGFEIRDRRAGRIRARGDELATALSGMESIDGVSLQVVQQKQHRVVVRLAGPGLSAAITDTDPGTDGVPQSVRWSVARTKGDPAAERTAAVLNQFLRRAHDVLADHPVNREREAQGLPVANGVLTRGAGAALHPDGLIERLGLRGALVAGDRAVLGLGRLLGFTPVTRSGFTGLIDSDPAPKVAAALEALKNHDIVWIHYKGTDIASHDRLPIEKRRCIERIDSALRPLIDEDIVVAVTADHTTNSNTGSHTADPVPALLRVPDGDRDDVTLFCEAACREGGLGQLRSGAFLRCVLRSAGMMPQIADAAT